MASPALPRPDILIAGAGIVGLSLALEMHVRGAQVVVLEKDIALRQTSIAAAGMLAAEDPHNPPHLLPLSRYSLSLYAGYLQHLERLSGISVPYQTETTVQHLSDGRAVVLPELSLDPRQLAASLLAAVRGTSIKLQEHTAASVGRPSAGHVAGQFGQFIDATGAWSAGAFPRKGQMLRVRLPQSLPLREVHRSQDIYVVPRTSGPQAGTALIGATIEEAGFDTTANPADLAALRARAAKLLPELASETNAPTVEAWAGLRPATPDELPLIGRDSRTNTWLASGHYRNGILLAPGTAVALADLLEGREPAVDLKLFNPERFG